MGGKSQTLKYFLIAFVFFFGFIYTVVKYVANKTAQMSYEDEVRKEIYENDSELKMRVYELCADNHSSPELNDLSFINASKDYINMERAKLGLPIVK